MKRILNEEEFIVGEWYWREHRLFKDEWEAIEIRESRGRKYGDIAKMWADQLLDNWKVYGPIPKP